MPRFFKHALARLFTSLANLSDNAHTVPQVASPSPHRLPNLYDTLFLHLRTTSSPSTARKLHNLLLIHGHLNQNLSAVLGSQLVHTYVALGCLQEALLVFHRLRKRNCFAWNSVLRGLLEASCFSETLQVYQMMLQQGLPADNFTYPLVLKACAALSDLEPGRKIRDSIKFDAVQCGSKPNVYVQCALIDMFAKCGSLLEAREVFEDMPSRDLVSWSSMICGTMQQGEWSEALCLFNRMRSEGFRLDSVIVATVIPACGRLEDLRLGMGLQCCAVKCGFSDDLCVSNALLDMYCKCGYTHIARHLFELIEHKDVVSWSSMVAGHSQNYDHSRSLDFFVEMMRLGMRPSSVTIASVLPGFAELKLLNQGKEIHSYAIRHGFQFDHFVASALIDLYCQCGSTREAEFIFDITSGTDIAIGNSLITGYAMKEDVKSAFSTLRAIRRAGLRPNSVTIVSLLPLCNHLTMLSQGKQLHGYAVRGQLQSVVSVSNSLIDMYCKCGCLELGRRVFQQMHDRDIVSYNTTIAALGMYGHGEEAIMHFKQMEKERIQPNNITFIALLSACSHAGLVDMGLWLYKSMIGDYNIVPDTAHYSCMVDLYGRAGRLEDAWEFINKMPVEPDIDVLGSLLAACRVYKRLDIAELVGEWIVGKGTEDPGYHILLSNIYAAGGRWADAKKIRTMIKEKGLMKKPGNSWIQIGCSIHSFLARDHSHPEFKMINRMMNILLLQMKNEGYVPDLSLSHNQAAEDDGAPAD